MITSLDIMQYRAGFLEEHPNEEIDDATVMSCLQDEQDQLIEKLIADDLQNPEFIAHYLAEGCDGYKNASVAELWEELNLRGLTL